MGWMCGSMWFEACPPIKAGGGYARLIWLNVNNIERPFKRKSNKIEQPKTHLHLPYFYNEQAQWNYQKPIFKSQKKKT